VQSQVLQLERLLATGSAAVCSYQCTPWVVLEVRIFTQKPEAGLTEISLLEASIWIWQATGRIVVCTTGCALADGRAWLRRATATC